MGLFWKLGAGVLALIFTLVGLAWWLAPDFAAAQLGMTLLGGAGLSSQIGDLASFFLTLGVSTFLGLATGIRLWLYPPVMLLGFAIFGRLIAWLFHGAALPLEMIAVEIVGIIVLLLASRDLGTHKSLR